MLPGRASTERSRAAQASDQGSAALEFILVGLVLLVPIVYLVVALGAIQGQALGVETGARQLARTIADSPDTATADARAARVLDAIIEEYGLDRESLDVEVACASGVAACPEAGATLTVTVTASVPLPLVPAILGLEDLARVPVEAASVQKVSRFWGAAP
jgi:Flp pilus assembly protein TadG